MRAFPANQEPGAVRPAGRLEQAGDLADLGMFTQVTPVSMAGIQPVAARIASLTGSVIAAPTLKRMSR
jgi:hypothetical protein